MSAPRATYRLQLTPTFGFEAARALIDYLDRLGVSHIYASPCLEAVRGSEHGYDVVDHARVREELGGEVGFAALCEALRDRDMGLVLDIVPNHMAIGTPDNALWWDVLENGPASEFAPFFDVDWDAAADNRVLLPILGERYADALEQGAIRVELKDARFVVRYHEHAFPAAPRSVGELLVAAASTASSAVDSAGISQLSFVGDALSSLPDAWSVDRKGAVRRRHDKTILFEQLERVLHKHVELQACLEREVARLSADVDRLDAWLERQNWRLAYWRAGAYELGYRRFFDVQTLVGLRIEDPEVFEATHARVIEWARAGKVDGLRIDHPDGLRDPEGYLQRLRAALPETYVVVEKILDGDEQLRESWPAEGTTGYDFMRLLDQVQVDPAGERALSALAEQAAGAPQSWDALVRGAKLEILNNVLASELERTVELARRALTSKRDLRDATRAELRAALSHVLASYDGYRSYVREGTPLHDLDRKAIATAVARAREAHVEGDARLWTALERALMLEPPHDDAVSLALTVQQLSSAVAAKAVEDTAGYRYLRLLALNEVGGSPGTFGISRAAFHRALARAKPASMLGSTTHDTKRGEDVRARLLVLSELAEEWSSTAVGWLARTAVHAAPELDRATQYFFLQTLVGAFPLSEERALAYMQKAAREAKLHTRWTAVNTGYEAALERYVRGVLGDAERMAEVKAFVDRIAPLGFTASLARTLIKLTAPGVPDVYQGDELWDLSLVDPDNRRAVDFGARRELLVRARELSPEAALAELDRGTPKLWLMARTLELRRRSPELFEAPYEALPTTGAGEEGVLAYARGDKLFTVVPRWPARAAQLGPDVRVRLPPGRMRDVLTGELIHATAEGVSVRALWSRFPVALLTRQP